MVVHSSDHFGAESPQAHFYFAHSVRRYPQDLPGLGITPDMLNEALDLAIWFIHGTDRINTICILQDNMYTVVRLT